MEKLLKAKEQMKEQKKESTLGMLKKYKGEVDKAKENSQAKTVGKKNDREM